jgi:hypothetical protein
MGQIMVVKSKNDGRIPFSKLQIGEAFKVVFDGFTYVKVSMRQTFCFGTRSLETMTDLDMGVLSVNATLTVEE